MPWVDELLVVDTGSVDDTVRIAESHGARVSYFRWCDDFAAARNESLRLARGEWLFWMDSDDSLSAENGGKLRSLVEGLSAESADAFVMQVRCPGPAGDEASVTVVDQVKLLRNDPRFRFEGRIHEQILGSIRRAGGRVAWTDVFVTHANADLSPEGRRRKHERDLRLLGMELEERPDCAFALFNLGMTLIDANREEEALGPLSRALVLSEPTESHVRKIFALLSGAYAALGRTATAVRICERGLAAFPRDPELLFRRGVLAQRGNDLRVAEHCYRSVLRPRSDRYFASIDRTITGYRAWQNLALVYEGLGEGGLAVQAWHEVVAQRRGDIDAWERLAELLVRDENTTALETQAAELQGEAGCEPVVALLRASSLLVRRRVEEAVGLLEPFADATERGLVILKWLCRAAFDHRLWPAAERYLRLLTGRTPDDPAAHRNLGAVLQGLGRHAEAEQSLRRSLELRPGYPPALDLLERSPKSSAPSAGPSPLLAELLGVADDPVELPAPAAEMARGGQLRKRTKRSGKGSR